MLGRMDISAPATAADLAAPPSGPAAPPFPGGAVPPFNVSERAARRIAEIMATQGADAAIRVAVQGGGCSGFRYQIDLDRQPAADDIVIEREGARVLVDPTSLEFLAGAELDFTDALMGAHFAVKNPNAKSSCGCGDSFAVD